MGSNGTIGGSTLRSFRQDRSLSQAELAKRSGVSERSIRGIESGAIKSPQPATIRAIADALTLTDDARKTLTQSCSARTLATLSDLLKLPVDDLRSQLKGIDELAAFSGSWTTQFHHQHHVIGADRHFQSSRLVRSLTATTDYLTHQIQVVGYDYAVTTPPLTYDYYACSLSNQWVIESRNAVVSEIALGRTLHAGESITYGFTKDTRPPSNIRSTCEPPCVLTNGSRSPTDTRILTVQFEGSPPPTIWSLYLDEPDGTESGFERIVPDGTGTVEVTTQDAAPGRAIGLRWRW